MFSRPRRRGRRRRRRYRQSRQPSGISGTSAADFGGENAEAYFSPDGTQLIFQSTRDGYPCDQIYTMKIDGTDLRRVSTGTGRTTCGYFYPGRQGDSLRVDARGVEACPPKPSYERGYVWPIYDGYDIYRANADGSNLTPLTTHARLRRRGDDRARRPDRVHQRARRRHGDLLDEGGRLGRASA